jgi:hypothetical protein
LSATAARVQLSTGVGPPEFVRLPSGADVPACRTTVLLDDDIVSVTLLLTEPGEPPPGLPDLATLVAEGPADACVVALEADGIGHAAVAAPALPDALALPVAMAAAVCAASWGWDESPQITVSLNEGRPWVIAPTYRDETWHATLRANGNALRPK